MIKHYEFTMRFYCHACGQHFTGVLCLDSADETWFTHPRCPYCGKVKNEPHVREEDGIPYNGGQMTIGGYRSALLEAGYSCFADGLVDSRPKYEPHRREPDGMQYADPEWKSRL